MWQAGPFSACLLPLTLTMLSNGDLVVFNKRGQVLWHSQSACSCDAGCYRAELQVSQLGMPRMQQSLLRRRSTLPALSCCQGSPNSCILCCCHPTPPHPTLLPLRRTTASCA